MSVDLNALAEVYEVRRSIQTRSVSRRNKDGCKNGRCGAFTIGAGDMNGLEVLVWVADGCQEGFRRVQAKFDSKALELVQSVER